MNPLGRSASPDVRLAARLVRNEATGCLEFTGKRTEYGYGSFRVNGKDTRTHIYVFERKHGYRPPMVCHSCDNPPCCEEGHLFAGTAEVNSADMAVKGRAGRRKLTESEVLAIRQVAKARGLPAKMADAYGVHVSTIRRIRAGRRRQHVAA